VDEFCFSPNGHFMIVTTEHGTVEVASLEGPMAALAAAGEAAAKGQVRCAWAVTRFQRQWFILQAPSSPTRPLLKKSFSVPCLLVLAPLLVHVRVFVGLPTPC